MVAGRPGECVRQMGLAMMAITVALAAVVLVAGCGDDSGPTGAAAMTYSDTLSSTFSVDFGPKIEVRNFVGSVTVRPSGTGLVEVEARKWAAGKQDLDKVTVTMNKVPGGVVIEAKNPVNVQNVQVDFVINAPEIAIWDISLGIGNIDYRGRPKGACGFSTGRGEVSLKLPQNMNALLNLSTGVGTISLGFPLDGQVTSNSAMGTIGNGSEAEIAASSNAGNVIVGP